MPQTTFSRLISKGARAIRISIVFIAAARSLNMIATFRFHRSTNAPAKGLTSIDGTMEKKLTKLNVVAFPVICQAQSVRANRVIPVPRARLLVRSRQL